MAERDANPVYVVLGATGGIGSELSRRLAKGGARLVLGARDGERLRSLAAELDALCVGLDATKPEEVDRVFARAVEEFGRIDGAVNCVGSFMLKPAHLTKDDEWAETMSLNLGTAFGTVKAAANHMPEGGSVVLLSSVAARVGLANHEAVAAAKAGVIGLAISAATTYLPRGLRINAVAPGLVQTPMTRKITASETSRTASEELHPMGRLGEPGDIAAAISWLLAPEAGWITGQVFGVDGGLSTLHPMPRRAAR
ncbi:SDR family oxidoreductase [Rubrobacter marinus]|uniref:SDR family oxidoreductase n=1 Tax=Rubrobacter marinus TaxID=2653852 RepID=A0A6G8PY87_9ACTN|nr:SDR family oxidoreductase [Rubrobacter marinus]QIN79171.1 SDR family oxidoreductase [Rubrobacter marinus]